MELIGQVDPEAPLLVVAVHLEAEHLDSELPILVTGVGKVAAAASVLGALAELERNRWPRRLVNLGTAGALRDGLHGTHVVGSVRQHDLDSASILALTGIDPGPALTLGEGPALLTGDRFIADPQTRARLGEEAALCDMEGYAVAASAARVGVPASLVKQVSDDADASARSSWAESVAACSAQLGAWLRSDAAQPHLWG